MRIGFLLAQEADKTSTADNSTRQGRHRTKRPRRPSSLMLFIKTIFEPGVFFGSNEAGTEIKNWVSCIFLLTFVKNHFIYESRCDLLRGRATLDVREIQSMKNATKKAAKPAKKKAAPKKKK